MILDAWQAVAAATEDITATPCTDGVLLTLAPMNSVFLAVETGPWEQLTATLDGDFENREPAMQHAILAALTKLQVFTLGGRAAIDRRGALVVVSDRLAHTLMPQDRLSWVFSLQVVANGMLSIIAATGQLGHAPSHDELQSLMTQRPS